MVSRCPTCRAGAVGSNPQYTEQPRGGGTPDTLRERERAIILSLAIFSPRLTWCSAAAVLALSAPPALPLPSSSLSSAPSASHGWGTRLSTSLAPPTFCRTTRQGRNNHHTTARR